MEVEKNDENTIVDDLADFIADDGSELEEDEDDIIKVEGGIRSDDEDESAEENDEVKAKPVTHISRARRFQHISENEAREIVRKVIDRMTSVAMEDENLILEKKPATKKLIILDEVVSEISKAKWSKWYIVEGIGDVIARWLQPLPDGSLPNITIRTAMLELIEKLPFREDDLIACKLGSVLCEMWQHENETPQNRVIIRAIVQQWLRPILKQASNESANQSVSFGNEKIEEKKTELGSKYSPLLLKESKQKITLQQRRARIPRNEEYNFKVMPSQSVSESDPIQGANINKLSKSLGDRARRSNMKISANSVNIEGRGLDI